MNQLIAIIGQIQTDSELECPPLTGATKPADTVPEFDSKIWPVATTILVSEINIPIPDDVNIFIDETTKVTHSIEEIAVFVCELQKKQGEKQAAACSTTYSQIAERLKARKLAVLSQGGGSLAPDRRTLCH